MFIDLVLIKENADGSAVYSFNLSDDARDALLRFGIMKALEAGVKEAEKLHPSFEEAEDMAEKCDRLTAERDAYMEAADKLAAENKALRDAVQPAPQQEKNQ